LEHGMNFSRSGLRNRRLKTATAFSAVLIQGWFGIGSIN
jgi:hypothetical protein